METTYREKLKNLRIDAFNFIYNKVREKGVITVKNFYNKDITILTYKDNQCFLNKLQPLEHLLFNEQGLFKLADLIKEQDKNSDQDS